jgi:hypothetical protein
MRIVKYGTVTLTEGDVRVEGWLFELDDDDPEDALPEELLLAYAIEWAKLRFKAAVSDTTMDAIRAMYRKGLEIKAQNERAHRNILDS